MAERSAGAPAGADGPLVSVIVPAHNEADYVGSALQSVFEQTLTPAAIEVIVVDNGSTDRTGDVVREAARGAPVRVELVHDPYRGIARAKNLGARHARGRFLVFLDADSRLSPGLLAHVVERAAAGEQSASIRVIADSRDLLDRGFFGLIEWGKRLFGIRANMSWMAAGLFARLGGFDERLNQAEDLDLLVRARRAGVRVGHLSRERIATSPRRLHQGPFRLGMLRVLGRWALGNFGIGRRWPY